MGLRPILVVPDAHIPYHDKRAWALVLSVGKFLRPDIVVCIGDLADFYSVSDHSKHPHRAFQLHDEVVGVCAALDELDRLGAKRKIYLAGNHEDRLQRYLQNKAPELFDFVDVASILGLAVRGWEYVPYKSYTKVGKVYFTHDIGQAGRYSVYRCLEAFDHSVVSGHAHRLAYVVEGDMTGEYKVSAQFGWLGDVNKIEYMQRAKAQKDWALGLGVGYLDEGTGFVYLTPVPIVQYTCCVNGRLFQA